MKGGGDLIDSSIIDEIKYRNDLVDVISSYVSLKRAGSGYTGLCPFHSEKTPSFHVAPEKRLFPLLRLRCGRRRYNLYNEDRKSQLSRGGAFSCGACGDSDGGGTHCGRREPRADKRYEPRCSSLLLRAAEGRARRRRRICRGAGSAVRR